RRNGCGRVPVRAVTVAEETENDGPAAAHRTFVVVQRIEPGREKAPDASLVAGGVVEGSERTGGDVGIGIRRERAQPLIVLRIQATVGSDPLQEAAECLEARHVVPARLYVDEIPAG